MGVREQSYQPPVQEKIVSYRSIWGKSVIPIQKSKAERSVMRTADIRSIRALMHLAIAIFLLTIGATFSPVTAGESYRVQAPFDSFVCYDVSLVECSKSITGTPDNFLFTDLNGGISKKTSDGKYGCDYRAILYKQTLSYNAPSAVSFYSPPLISQLNDGLRKLDRARESCNFLVETYNSQLMLLKLQDEQALSQLQIQYLTSRIEETGLSTIGGEEICPADGANLDQRCINVVDGNLTIVTDTNTVRGELRKQRDANTKLSEKIRNMLRDQTVNSDYKKQFTDAQFLIDAQVSELNRGLFVLDRAKPNIANGSVSDKVYDSGSWVQQGSHVCSVSSHGK